MTSTSIEDPNLSRYTRQWPRITYVKPDDSRLRSSVVDGLERLFGRNELQRLYERVKTGRFDPDTFFRSALEIARIEVDRDSTRERLIPRTGPLIFIANHPFGVVDGTILCDLAARTRGDFKILIHALLCQDADLAPFFLPVDFEDTPDAMRNNILSRRAAVEALKNEGTLLVFPGGGVSTARRFGFGPVEDLPWTTFIAKLVQRSRATVVPIFFHGSNSRLFQVASHWHPSLRTGLFLREAKRQFGKTVRMEIGAPIPYASVAHIKCRRRLTGYLHRRTWELAGVSAACTA